MENFLRGTKGKSKQSSAVASTSKEAATSSKIAHIPWIEKYRPKTVDDVVQQDEVVAVLKKVLQGADLPNLLFYGPPGTGKTSTILAMGRQLFGDVYRSRILELNASDERGIQVVRDKVKKFAQLTAGSIRPDGRPCLPLKIIILDEADSMTPAAQAALRRIMEKESKTTRFCLICNYISRIIEPLTSRCSKFRFKQLSHDILVKRLREISELENVRCSSNALDVLINTSDGDLRKAITTLQSAYRLKQSKEIQVDDVYEIAGIVPEEWLDKLIVVCASSYEKLEEYVQGVILEGFAVIHIFNDLHDKILTCEQLTDVQKSIVLESIAVAEHRLIEGADEYLQLMVVCTTISQQLLNKN